MKFTDKFDPEDYYLSPEGYVVFTEKYHLKRGYCCQSSLPPLSVEEEDDARSENTHPDLQLCPKTLGAEKLDLTKTKRRTAPSSVVKAGSRKPHFGCC